MFHFNKFFTLKIDTKKDGKGDSKKMFKMEFFIKKDQISQKCMCEGVVVNKKHENVDVKDTKKFYF